MTWESTADLAQPLYGWVAVDFPSDSGQVTYPLRLPTANHAFGPPAENLTSVNSGCTSICVGCTESTSQPSVKASYSSCRDTLRGPSPACSSSLKDRACLPVPQPASRILAR